MFMKNNAQLKNLWDNSEGKKVTDVAPTNHSKTVVSWQNHETVKSREEVIF